MSQQLFLTYQRFMNQQDAQDLADLLTASDIQVELEDGTTSFDPSFANNAVHQEFRVKLQQHDFQRADDLLLEQSATLLEGIEEDYYLLQFTNEELLEILENRDTWNKFDFLLAQKLLNERGVHVSDAELQAMQERRLKILAQPDKDQTIWVAIGYISALFGGFFGIFMGWHLYTHKKTLPNGTRVYGYAEKDRKQGRIIFILGCLFFAFFLFRAFNN